MFPASRSTAAGECFRATCEQRTVIAMLLWPMSSWRVRISTPAITRALAKVCRKQSQENPRISARRMAGSNQWRGPASGWPRALRIAGPVPSPGLRSYSSAASAARFSGT